MELVGNHAEGGAVRAIQTFRNLELDRTEIWEQEPLRVSMMVANLSQLVVDEVVQLYIRHDHTPVKVPRWQCAGLERLHLVSREQQYFSIATQRSNSWPSEMTEVLCLRRARRPTNR